MVENSGPTIEERENGPLIAKGITSIRGDDGADLPVKPVMALCRCGHSKNKPFCDGSHKSAEFQSRGGNPAGRDRLITYEGAEISITYNPRLCSHAAECARIAGNIFDTTASPWVQLDNGTVDEVKAVVAACPSGAFALASGDHIMPDRAEIVVEKNGPYWVTGPVIEGISAGEGASGAKYVLCRCGLSGNKPYCDGSHRDAGWKSGN
ncbi:MAG: CDGSH iron-sulfur domain-containing protein [Paracoccaceae bacterium]